jgi:RNA 3'-terminal phosphate cyclase (ATP)
VRSFRETDAAVDKHLADQLLVVLALAGGQLRVPAMTDHVETSLELLETFGFEPAVDTTDAEPLISIKRSTV